MTPRPRKWRYCQPFKGSSFYKPQGIPLAGLDIVELAQDELEAMRHCDFEELDQEQAAKVMNISRGTIQRLLYSGRKKLIDALINTKAIKVIGNEYILPLPGPFAGRRFGRRFRGGR